MFCVASAILTVGKKIATYIILLQSSLGFANAGNHFEASPIFATFVLFAAFTGLSRFNSFLSVTWLPVFFFLLDGRPLFSFCRLHMSKHFVLSSTFISIIPLRCVPLVLPGNVLSFSSRVCITYIHTNRNQQMGKEAKGDGRGRGWSSWSHRLSVEHFDCDTWKRLY